VRAHRASARQLDEVNGMATVRDGNQGVLLVVDVQVGPTTQAWEAARVVANVARTIERARAAGVPVVWVLHADDDMPVGSPAWQLAPPLVPARGEPVVHKTFNSAFERTELEPLLAGFGATHLVLAGAQTNWCIRSTAHAALERGYDLTVVRDAHTTVSMDLEGGRRIEAEAVVDEFNVAMTWMDYPGRRCATALAEAVDFGRPGGAR
jgi:nicotinamidase-related amidase